MTDTLTLTIPNDDGPADSTFTVTFTGFSISSGLRSGKPKSLASISNTSPKPARSR